MPRLQAALPSGPAPSSLWEIPGARVNVTVIMLAIVMVAARLGSRDAWLIQECWQNLQEGRGK
jgi:hypothetical protein